MRVAILGATGFIGYDFTRSLLNEPDVEPTVFATSATNLTNISRHDIPVRLISYDELERGGLDADFDVIVNFAHPFKQRGDFSQVQQVRILANTLKDALRANQDLRLIHISTMSVHEPFNPGKFFSEMHKPRPPKSDSYATSKAMFDKLLQQDEELAQRVMLPRPTIVYGPFCRPWTDGMIASFLEGDVLYASLEGKMQPLYVRDLSRFLILSLLDFKPGVLNVAGNETITWCEFFSFFEGMVGRGKLVKYDSPDTAGKMRTVLNDVKTVIDTLIAEPAFTRLAKPISQFIPKRTRVRVETKVRKNLSRGKSGVGKNLSFLKPFFAEDRLVSTELFHQRYPEFEFTRLAATKDTLTKYMRFRFTDASFAPTVGEEVRSNTCEAS